MISEELIVETKKKKDIVDITDEVKSFVCPHARSHLVVDHWPFGRGHSQKRTPNFGYLAKDCPG